VVGDGIQFNDLVGDDDEDDFDIDDIDIDLGSPNVNIEADMDDYDVNLNDSEDDRGMEGSPSEHGFGFGSHTDSDAGGNDVDETANLGTRKNIKTNEYTTFVLGELYRADRNLFMWPDADTKLKNYSSKCGAVNYRQPVVINANEKARIDATQPDSYTGFVQTGSTEELKNSNYYIALACGVT